MPLPGEASCSIWRSESACHTFAPRSTIFAELGKIKVDAPTIAAEIKNSNSTRSHGATGPSNMTLNVDANGFHNSLA